MAGFFSDSGLDWVATLATIMTKELRPPVLLSTPATGVAVHLTDLSFDIGDQGLVIDLALG